MVLPKWFLDFADVTPDERPLVIIDFETTGFHPAKCKILECHVLHVDFVTLEVRAEANWILTPMLDIPKLPRAVRNMHTKNGLFEAIEKMIDAGDHFDTKDLERELNGHFGLLSEDPHQIILGGNSVGFDIRFIYSQLPTVAKHLFHRVLDASVLKTVFRQWFAHIPNPAEGSLPHRAREDCYDTLNTLREMRDVFYYLQSVVRARAPLPRPTGEVMYVAPGTGILNNE